MLIRAAISDELDAIKALIRAAFPADECERIAQLVDELASAPSSEDTLSLVALEGQAIMGYVAFSPLTLSGDSTWCGYILSPLAVVPDCQGRGIGSRLVRKGINLLTDRGADWLFVYGDPAYYGRFGFDAAAAERFAAPCELAFPFGWQTLGIRNSGGPDQGQVTCVEALRDPDLW